MSACKLLLTYLLMYSADKVMLYSSATVTGLQQVALKCSECGCVLQ